ncbi:MAG: hypothetical protein FWH32_00440 [Clostridiales bacterium]|nr:hypothetical protein [Clostridiales bacterium]
MVNHETNESGNIRIGRGVVESVSAHVVGTFEGHIIVSDRRGRMKHSPAVRAESEKGFARARMREGRLDIKLYLIVQFGTSMRKSAKTLADRLREEFPLQTGIEVGLVTMVFVGTLAEKLSKRHVVFVDDGKQCEIVEDE